MEKLNGHKGVDKPNTYWTLEKMIEAIWGLKNSDPPIPVYTNYLRRHNPSLKRGMLNYPGGWRAVIRAAGLDPEEEIGKPGGDRGVARDIIDERR